MPTIWARLADRGVSHAYYVDVPFLALHGSRYVDIARTYRNFSPTVALDATPEAGTGKRGIRTPALMVSPRSRAGSLSDAVSHVVYGGVIAPGRADAVLFVDQNRYADGS